MISLSQSRLTWIKSSRSADQGACVEVATVPEEMSWRKSSYSGDQGSCVEVATVPARTSWLRSSHSSDQGGNCVEVAYPAGGVAARDSKDPHSGVLVFEHSHWKSFLDAVRREKLEHG
ncbi:protein of unknown function [Actinopolyspora alba]|uniref:DUF397 domain-containing protein n=1 Tax=Actinopolyspora alba TaxID=673379 RepID=A0A1I1VHW2_9ACTN|nr:DUF397 domain-containing protein [Actinopolyspora alba]SFD81608.1 protein of unknown function [Actinopolyspora alba]